MKEKLLKNIDENDEKLSKENRAAIDFAITATDVLTDKAMTHLDTPNQKLNALLSISSTIFCRSMLMIAKEARRAIFFEFMQRIADKIEEIEKEENENERSDCDINT